MLIENTTIKSGESINGYFLRVAEANGMSHIRHFLAPFNIKPRVSYGKEQIERLARTLEWSAEDLHKANPTAGALLPKLNARFIPVDRCAVCPHCLASDEYLHSAWDNVLVTACTKHEVQLVDQCPNCESPLTLERSSVRHCDCGQDLAHIKTDAADPFLLAIAAKLLGVQMTHVALLPEGLQQQGPHGLDGFFWYLHCYSDSTSSTFAMRRPYPATLADARLVILGNLRNILADWPSGLHQLLKALETRAGGDSAGISKQLGNWYRMLFTKFRGDEFYWIHDAFAHYVSQHFAGTLNDRTTRVPRGLTQIKGWVAIAEAAHMLKIQGQRLRVALDSNLIQGEVRSSGAQRDFCFIRQSEIDRIKAERSNYCSGRDVQRRLDITKIQLIRLVEAAAFHRYDEGQRPPLVDFDYLESEVIAFLDSLEKFYEFRAIEPSHRKNMSDVVVTRASNAQQVLLVYQHIVKGTLRARAIDTNEKGLNRFIFDADEINEVCAVDLGGTTLTMTQVCEITGWKSEVLSQWIKAGLLPAKYIPNGATKATLIRMDDLIRFMQNHLVLADVASAGKTKSSFLIKSLESQDCPVVSFKNDAGVRFGVLMRHADLANVIRKSTAANECAA